MDWAVAHWTAESWLTPEASAERVLSLGARLERRMCEEVDVEGVGGIMVGFGSGVAWVDKNPGLGLGV